jgi:hypothetical protein
MKLVPRTRSTLLRASPLLLAALLLGACSGGSRRAASVPATPMPPVQAVAQAPIATATAAPTTAPADAATPAPSAAEISTPAQPLSASITPLGQVSFGGQGFNGDVFAHNGFAYVGTWGYGGACPATGVKIVDLSDPTQPRQTGVLAAMPGTTQEKMIVRHVSTSAFSGDLLAVGIQRCDPTSHAPAGASFWDVSDPLNPVQLGFFPTGSARGVHELDLVQQGDRVLALLAVPYAERVSGGSELDFRIVDASDPRHPAQLAQWGVGTNLGLDVRGGIGCNRATFDHSARASADGRYVYLSYWDAGVIVLDISDPTAPRLAGRIQYPADEEGETHSVAEADGGRELLVADEDGIFGPPYHLHFRVQTPTGASDVYGCEAFFSPPLASRGRIDAQLVAVGSGCPGSRFAQDPRGTVALVDDGGCGMGEKAAALAQAGALALIAPQQGDPVAAQGGAIAALPIVTVRAGDAATLKQAAAGGPLPITLPSEKHSGGLRIWDISNLAAPRQLAVYQTPDSAAFPPPDDGFYTVHNPEVAGNVAYLSWYSDGLRVLDISDPANPREIASYVPPAAHNPFGVEFPNRTLVWGVHLAGDLVLLSDINGGLYVLRVDVSGG